MRRLKDLIVKIYALSTFIIGVIPLISLIIHVLINSILKLNLEVILSNPRGIPLGVEGGILNAIVGTTFLIFLAIIWVYVGVGIGIFLTEREDSMITPILRLCIDSLAWVPAIIWGLFGYIVFSLYFSLGFSALAGGLTLGLMMIPYVAKYTEESLKTIPKPMIEGALALGAPRWRVMGDIWMKAALTGVVSGVLLGVIRIMGEAAPVLFTSYWNNYPPSNVFEPAATLPFLIYYYSQFPYPELHAKAYVASLLLILMVISAMIITRVIARFFKIVYR